MDSAACSLLSHIEQELCALRAQSVRNLEQKVRIRQDIKAFRNADADLIRHFLYIILATCLFASQHWATANAYTEGGYV